MQKNVASQKLIVFAFDATTGLPKTGDSANLTAYVSIDYGSVTVLGDTSATEMDATNAKGYYLFDLTQAETNGNTLLFSAKSSTSNIVVVGAPAVVQTVPAAFVLAGGASGGFLISGSNAGTTTLGALTVTGATTLTGNVSMAAGCNITQSSSNTSALVVTGNGTGHGAIFTSGSGATGDGIKAIAASTNGNGMSHVSTGTGSGILTDKITASGAVAFQSTLAVTTSTSLGALSCTTLTASGAVAFQSTFATTGTTTFNAFTVTNALTVSGATTLTGAVTATNAGNDIRGITVAGYASGQAPLRPTVAGRTLDVTATGAAGIDWGNVENQSGSVNLSNTIVTSVGSVTQVLSIDSGAFNDSDIVLDYGNVVSSTGTTVTYTPTKPTTPACLVGSVVTVRFDGANNLRLAQPRIVTSASTSAGDIVLTVDRAWDVNPSSSDPDAIVLWAFGAADLQSIKSQTVTASGGVTFPASTLASTTNITAGTITTVSGNVTGTVASIVSPGNVWDVVLASHLTAGSTGFALNAAGSAGDPWATALPGAYGAGTAGFIVGTNLNATVTSRMATYTQPTGFLAATFPSAVSSLTQTQVTGGAYSVQSSSCVLGDARIADLDATVSSRASATVAPSWYTAPGTAPTAAQNATAVWTDLLAGSDFSTVGSVGKLLKDDIDAAISTRAPSSTALSTAQWTNALATNLGTTNTTVATNLNATITSRSSNADMVKVLAAVYDSATGSGGNVLTLSNGAVQTIDLSTGSRTTT